MQPPIVDRDFADRFMRAVDRPMEYGVYFLFHDWFEKAPQTAIDAYLQDLLVQGVRARLYVPFALGWDLAIEYLRRRLDEYPAMMWLVTKNMVWRS